MVEVIVKVPFIYCRHIKPLSGLLIIIGFTAAKPLPIHFNPLNNSPIGAALISNSISTSNALLISLLVHKCLLSPHALFLIAL